MANILFVGYGYDEAHRLRIKVGEILKEISLDKESITTVVQAQTYPADVWQSADMPKLEAPFIMVRDTDLVKARKIAEIINERLVQDVEMQIIEAFFPKKPAT